MKTIATKAASGLAILALSACTAGQTGPPTVNVPSNPLNGKLQLAVGTANLYGTHKGLNVVVTFRQPAGATAPGDSAALVTTPTLTLPTRLPNQAGSPDVFGSTIESGPTAGLETGKFVMQATPQQNPGDPTIPSSTFGVAGGAFGLGIFPGNYSSVGNASVGTGVPDSLVPYTIPLYDQFAGTSSGPDPNTLVPWGGPPAFDPDKDGKGTRDGTGFDPSVLGVAEGLDPFAGIVPAIGTYTLSVMVPSNQGQSNGSVKATASLSSSALLPLVPVPAPALNSSGGGTFAVILPPGVSDAYVQIVDYGLSSSSSSSSGPANCNSANPFVPVFYTLHTSASGTLTLPDEDGPGSIVVNPHVNTPSLCTAAQNAAAGGTNAPDSFSIQTIGFNYPLYEASYPMSIGNPLPRITGPNGQADLSISPVVCIGTCPSASSSSSSSTHRRQHTQPHH